MARLIVMGCSVSDYTSTASVWGEFLSKLLGIEYIHLAASCGSNYRMWRILSSKIISGDITPDDIVMLQYTTIERNEFWSHTAPDKPYNDTKMCILKEPYNDGCLIKFKFDSYTWNQGNEKKLLKLYENFINEEFEKEKFINNHIAFQCLAKEYNINNLYFIKIGGYCFDDIPMINKYKDNFLKYKDILSKGWHLPNDPHHLNMAGHKELAHRIFKVLDYND